MAGIPTRDEAWALLTEYNKDNFHLKHAVTVEGVMRWYAEKLGYGAAALMRSSKSVQDIEFKSVKKKYKSTNFAAGCSREVIERGAELMKVSLDELITDTILAMRSCEDKYNAF